MARSLDDMNDRTCIVTGHQGSTEDMIRFVASPDGVVVPDLKNNLPGRGCWVIGERAAVEKAVARNLFKRGLKAAVTADESLVTMLDGLMKNAALQSLAMARKAGCLTSGAMLVDKAIRSGKAIAVLNALDAAPDGVRKTDQARRAVVHLDGPDIPAFRLFQADEMHLAFGAGHVIHAAILDGGAGKAALRQLKRLDRYREGAGQEPDKSTKGKAPAGKRTEYER